MQQYFAKEKKNNDFILNNDDYNHIKNVMRMKKDDEIIVVYDDKSYVCSLNGDLLSCSIKSIFKANENIQKFVVYVPLLNEEKLSFIFQHGTELGITDFVVVEYDHCKYKLPKKDYEKKLIRWNKIIKEASEQSYRINKPSLGSIISSNDIPCEQDVNIMCSLDKNNVKSMCQVLTTNEANDTISLVFGPEGGLSQKEEERLVSLGFTKTSLGSDVLRTETVPLMVASILKYLREFNNYANIK